MRPKKIDALDCPTSPFDEEFHTTTLHSEIDELIDEEEREFVRDQLNRALPRVSELEAQVLQLRVVAGLSTKEVAEILGRTPSNISSIYALGLERIRNTQEALHARRAFRRGRLWAFPAIFWASAKARALTILVVATCSIVGAGILTQSKDASSADLSDPAPTSSSILPDGVNPSSESLGRSEGEVKTLDAQTGVERVEVWHEGRIFSVYHHKPELEGEGGRPFHFHGDRVSFHTNGNVREVVGYANGTRDGVSALWDSEGDLQSANFYIQGKLNRPATIGEADARRMRYDHSTR
ncbi:MAG: sigma-70 family RNA polymerase sigma factor [Planctomycetes bacterium]|nr:sigma-70 family RNA polymerase sigma factor [Planctomycetota bacterium]